MGVCLLLYISLLERPFVPETIPSTQRPAKVRKRSVAKLERGKANMQIHNGLLRHDRSACSAYLRGTRRCKVGRVSPLACYLVRSVVSPRREPQVTPKTKPSPSISGTAHAFTNARARHSAPPSSLGFTLSGSNYVMKFPTCREASGSTAGSRD